MQNPHTIVLVTKLKEDSVNNAVGKYLQRGYTIHSAVKYTSFEDGSLAVRFELRYDYSALSQS